VACLSVYALTRLRFGNAFDMSFLAVVYSTRILPPAAIALPLYLLAHRTGTLDSRFALVTTYAAINLPLAVWLLFPVFGLRASHQEESALLEGASHARVLTEILLPMTISGAVAAGFLVFVQCWNEYYLAVHLAGDKAMTLPPFLVGQMSIKEAQVGGDGDEWPQFSAATMIAVIPLLAVTGFAQTALSRVAGWRG
jgi:multiple sugar transport system permease protein